MSEYAVIGVSNVFSTYFQYEALKYLSFPAQVLGKTAKSFPVLLWGSLVMGGKYDSTDLVNALVVFLGCSVFLLFGELQAYPGAGMAWGVLLMVGYLAFDGLTSTSQERFFRRFTVSSFHLMFFSNMHSLLASVLLSFATIDPLRLCNTPD